MQYLYRSRVQQINGGTNSTQRHSGNVLPPLADENYNNSPALSGKLINITATSTNQNLASGTVVSPPNSSSGRSATLPAGASWYVKLDPCTSCHALGLANETRYPSKENNERKIKVNFDVFHWTIPQDLCAKISEIHHVTWD